MAELADEERLAEINRNKERYEQMQEEQKRGEERQLADDVRENKRRLQLQQQREEEERKQREEVERSAERIAEAKRKYREQKERDEVERSAKILEEKRRERDIRRGYDSHGKPIGAGIDAYNSLTKEDKAIVRDEVEKSAGRIARARREYREQQAVKQKDTYYKTKSTGDQLKDMLLGKKEPWKPKEQKQVQPITTFLGGQKEKAKGMFTAGAADLLRPVKGVQEGRRKRATKQHTIPDPLAGLTASQQQQRVRRHRPREGTGFLFSEGFFNPPARAAPRKGKKGRRRRSPLDFDMGSMVL